MNAGRETTIGEALHALTGRLRSAGQDDADSVAEMAVGHVLGVRPLDVHLRAREPLDPHAAHAVGRLAERLARHEPIQYVTGRAWFAGMAFEADARALIPRPETEMLLHELRDNPRLQRLPHPDLADVGTGSGIIAIALARAFPAARILALDSSADALDLARANARRHRVTGRITLRRGDLLAGLPPGSLDAVAANLPYVATADLQGLAPRVARFEPRSALDGGPDGLAVIRRLVPQAAAALRPGGLLAMEIGESQGPPVLALLRGHGFVEPTLRRDLAGHDRLVRGVRRGRA